MIRAANSTSQHSIARVSGPKAIFLKVMHMVFGRKWNGSQTIIVVYHVRPVPPLKVEADLLYFRENSRRSS